MNLIYKHLRFFSLLLAVAVTAAVAMNCFPQHQRRNISADVEVCFCADKASQTTAHSEAHRTESKLDAAVKTVAVQLGSVSLYGEKKQSESDTVKPVAFVPLIYSNSDDTGPE